MRHHHRWAWVRHLLAALHVPMAQTCPRLLLVVQHRPHAVACWTPHCWRLRFSTTCRHRPHDWLSQTLSWQRAARPACRPACRPCAHPACHLVAQIAGKHQGLLHARRMRRRHRRPSGRHRHRRLLMQRVERLLCDVRVGRMRRWRQPPVGQRLGVPRHAPQQPCAPSRRPSPGYGQQRAHAPGSG